MQAGKAARMAEIQAAKKPKNKTRGRNKIGKREKKKDINIIDEKRKQRMDQLDRSFFSLTLTPTPTPTPTLTLTLTLTLILNPSQAPPCDAVARYASAKLMLASFSAQLSARR